MRWQTLVIQAPGRQRQEDCLKFKARLIYRVNCRRFGLHSRTPSEFEASLKFQTECDSAQLLLDLGDRGRQIRSNLGLQSKTLSQRKMIRKTNALHPLFLQLAQRTTFGCYKCSHKHVKQGLERWLHGPSASCIKCEDFSV